MRCSLKPRISSRVNVRVDTNGPIRAMRVIPAASYSIRSTPNRRRRTSRIASTPPSVQNEVQNRAKSAAGPAAPAGEPRQPPYLLLHRARRPRRAGVRCQPPRPWPSRRARSTEPATIQRTLAPRVAGRPPGGHSRKSAPCCPLSAATRRREVIAHHGAGYAYNPARFGRERLPCHDPRQIERSGGTLGFLLGRLAPTIAVTALLAGAHARERIGRLGRFAWWGLATLASGLAAFRMGQLLALRLNSHRVGLPPLLGGRERRRPAPQLLRSGGLSAHAAAAPTSREFVEEILRVGYAYPPTSMLLMLPDRMVLLLDRLRAGASPHLVALAAAILVLCAT